MLYGDLNLKMTTKRVRRKAMYVDEYVISGLIIVALTCSLFYGFYRFIKSDIEKHKNDPVK